MRDNVFFLVTEVSFFVDLSVKILEVCFCQSAVFEEFGYLVVNVRRELWLVTLLYLKLVDQHALELLTLLYVHESLASFVSHTTFGGLWSL